MDEIWQRHKSFIVQVFVGGLVFLIAYMVFSSTFEDQADPAALQERNKQTKAELESQVQKHRAPLTASIADQKRMAESSERQIRELGGQVASLREGDAYVREHVEWVLRNIGKPQEADRLMELYRTIPQAALSRLRDEARQVLVGRAQQIGREIDETLGLGAGFQDDEIPAAIHGLAIATEIVDRALGREGIQSVTDMQIQPRSRFGADLTFVTAVPVKLTLTGQPADVNEIIRSFSRRSGDERMLVLEQIEYLSRVRTDEDTVKSKLHLVGLQLKGVKE